MRRPRLFDVGDSPGTHAKGKAGSQRKSTGPQRESLLTAGRLNVLYRILQRFIKVFSALKTSRKALPAAQNGDCLDKSYSIGYDHT